MRRLDFERTPLRNPFNKETPGRILHRKWNNKLAFEGGWWKAYLFSIICVVYLALLSIWIAYSHHSKLDFDPSFLNMLAFAVLAILFVITRFQLYALPALTVIKESKESLWVHFKMTLAGGHTVAYAMFLFALDRCVLPLIVLSTLLSSARLIALDIAFPEYSADWVTYVIFIPVTVIIFGLLGIIMSGLGYIGALAKKSSAAVWIAILAPVMISILVEGPDYAGDYITMLKEMTFFNLSQSPATLLLAPENLITSLLIAPNSSISLSSVFVSLEPFIRIILQLAGFSAAIWLGLWAWLYLVLPDPHLEKQI